MPPVPAAACVRAYRPRAAEHTVLHRVVRTHLATFLRAAEAGGGVPSFVERTVRADDRPGLERLCHYLLRPPLAQERVEILPDGRIGLTLAHAWADGTRALVFGGVEFLEKLAVLIPKPRSNLLIYHGILGARARRRRAACAAAAVPATPAPAMPSLPDAPTGGPPPPGGPSPSRRTRHLYLGATPTFLLCVDKPANALMLPIASIAPRKPTTA
jgi:hypothetical protein